MLIKIAKNNRENVVKMALYIVFIRCIVLLNTLTLFINYNFQEKLNMNYEKTI